ncbi:MAG: HAMP domain-containing histidine kinase [Ruminococcaceae bacterium]|nr:HAMP domain-containing histidine kinase [Oscillospiraceae bacterium]
MSVKFSKSFKIGIRAKLIMGFMAFTLLIGILLWVFETFFLNSFYVIIKEQELKNTANYIEKHVYSDNLYDEALSKLKSTDIDVLVCDNTGKTKLQISQLGSDSLIRFDRELRLKIYRDTWSEGGEQLTNFSVKYQKPEATPDLGAMNGINYLPEMNDKLPLFKYNEPVVNDSMIYTKVISGNRDDSRLIILITDMVPVDSMVETLKYQLLWVTVIMVVLSLFLSLILSRSISKPIVAITKNAEKLAQGNYDIHFEDSSTKEISQLANTLNYTRSELNKVDEFRKELIANVSHDLRTPLTMIHGYSEVMRDIPGENTPENVQIIIDEAERLNLLVNDLLDISKLESGKMELNKEKFNLTKLINDILKRYDKLADYKIRFEYEKECFVFADELKITQVLYNLINNAITYTGEDKCIYLNQEIIKNEVKISVTDTGEGIPQDKLPYIWERYYKISKNHKRANVGTGLGLSIVKNILSLHGGKYGVISDINKGSTFYFTLNLSSDIL